MKPALYFHIGIHRTGTSYLQNLLAANRPALEAQGFRYAFDTRNHTGAAWKIQSGKMEADVFCRQLEEDAAGFPGHAMIVSGEDFSSLRDVGLLAPLGDRFDVRVVCYLRRQDQWLESWYNQHVKWPWSRQFSTRSAEWFFENIHEFHWLDYHATLRRWASVFGARNILVGVFEKSQLDQSLENDFCRRCGIDVDRLAPIARRINASAPPQAIEFLRHLDLLGKDTPIRLILNSAVLKTYRQAGFDQERHFISARRRRAIVAQFESSNQAVAREFLGRDDGRLFLDPLPADDPTEPAIRLPAVPELAQRVVRPAAMQIVKQIASAERRQEGRNRNDKLMDQLDRRHTRLFARRQRLQEDLQSPWALLNHLLRGLNPASGAGSHE